MKTMWKSLVEMEPNRSYVVLASSIPARSRAPTAALFRGSRQVRRQLAHTAGVVGFSLLARPWHKQYATLSIWDDAAALAAFAASDPHRELMAALGPQMAPTRFVRWQILGRDGRPTWSDALLRLTR